MKPTQGFISPIKYRNAQLTLNIFQSFAFYSYNVHVAYFQISTCSTCLTFKFERVTVCVLLCTSELELSERLNHLTKQLRVSFCDKIRQISRQEFKRQKSPTKHERDYVHKYRCMYIRRVDRQLHRG